MRYKLDNMEIKNPETSKSVKFFRYDRMTLGDAVTETKNGTSRHGTFRLIVKHPRFEKFYQNLRNEGYLIRIGDTSNVKATGDIFQLMHCPVQYLIRI